MCIRDSSVLDKLARLVKLITSGLSDIFSFPAFFRKLWNIQNAGMVVDSKVDTLHHATVYECVHEEVIPASLLCQQVTFKLSATTPL